MLALASLAFIQRDTVSEAVNGVSLPSAFQSDPCHSWNPHAAEEHDPPACFRAQQFRQIARFTSTPE